MCGECRQNEPFSFKVRLELNHDPARVLQQIEKPGRGKGGKSGRKAVCSDEAR